MVASRAVVGAVQRAEPVNRVLPAVASRALAEAADSRVVAGVALRAVPVNLALPAAAFRVVAEAVRRAGLVNRAVPEPVALDAAARPDCRVVPAWAVVPVVPAPT